MGEQSDQTTAVVLSADRGSWQGGALPSRTGDALESLLVVLRQQPGDNVMALVNVADEFFVAARLRGGAVSLLLSDVTAAVAWDLAREVVERLEIEQPGEEDLDDVWPAGDLSMFADLGVDELTMGAILSDLDAYADEMLLALTEQLGIDDVYRDALREVNGATVSGRGDER